MSSSDGDWLAARYERERRRLRAVAYRILGSVSDADDAVQDAWLRVSRSDTDGIDNMSGFFTTVVARVSLSMLQSRKTRREDLSGTEGLQELQVHDGGRSPEDEALVGDAVGPALMLVLDTLSPSERLAFVLHDVFAVPFDEIGEVLQKTPEAARQLASRARRRVRGVGPVEADEGRRREVVAAFLAASRHGDFARLLALLAPDAHLRADAATVRMGAPAVVEGADAVAGTFSGRAQAARLAVVDGVPGAVWFVGPTPKVVFEFDVDAVGLITAIRMIADADTIGALDVETV